MYETQSKNAQDRRLAGPSSRLAGGQAEPAKPAEKRRPHGVLAAIMLAAILSLILWSAMTRMTGVTRSTGMVVPYTQNQIVQHLEGGIVSDILVKQGDAVEQDQVLVRIDDGEAKSNLEQTLTQLIAKRASLARLEAELTDADTVIFPDDLPEGPALRDERDLFAKQRSAHAEELLMLGDKIAQQQISLSGLRKRLENQKKEMQILSEKLANVKHLSDMGAISQNDLLQAMNNVQEVQTRIDDLQHEIPQTEASLSEAMREKNSSTLKLKSAAAEDKIKTLQEINQLQESAKNLSERAHRADIRAPVAGTVNKMMVSTKGGVIPPGAPILEIVPKSDMIAIEAQLSPQDRAQIWPGTKAVVKITAYDYSVYGGLPAEVVDISADVIKDKEGPPYFRVRLDAPNTLGDQHRIIPGMMANIDMKTKDYTILEYLLSPIINTADVALRQ
jgi:HlyD family type I secretion membrane fusion protein